MNKQRAFTLLEILVVVAIIGLLVAILFPAFRMAKIAARRGRCLSNIRQICVALHDFSIVNNNKLPSDNPPWGAGSPTASLSGYLSGDGYRALECPADEGNAPGTDRSLFQSQGASYTFVNGDQQGMSAVCGSVSWQENPMGEMPSIGQLRLTFEYNTRYNGTGPETIQDPNLRDRDVTQVELDGYWATIKSGAESMVGKQNFSIDSGLFNVPYVSVNSVQIPGTGTDPVTNPARYTKYGPAWDNATNPPRADQFAGAPGNGTPIATGRTGWASTNIWARTVYNYDYWRCSSKKVAVLDADAGFGYNAPAVGDGYPKTGKGFWHGYPYVIDPNSPTDTNRLYYHVMCHAGFLDGHAAAIELNMYEFNPSTATDSAHYFLIGIDRDKHPYY